MPYLCFDVSFLKENIVAAIPLQQSETRSCHRGTGKEPAQGLLCKSAAGRWARDRAAININISSDVSHYAAAAAAGSSPQGFHGLQKHQQTPSLLCLEARNVEQRRRRRLSAPALHFHSKYTDHCARLRKQGLCILAGGIYSERATDLLYLVLEGGPGLPGLQTPAGRQVGGPRAACQR